MELIQHAARIRAVKDIAGDGGVAAVVSSLFRNTVVPVTYGVMEMAHPSGPMEPVKLRV